MKTFFYSFTFEEEESKDLKMNNVKRKENLGFGIGSHREAIFEFLIHYIRN